MLAGKRRPTSFSFTGKRQKNARCTPTKLAAAAELAAELAAGIEEEDDRAKGALDEWMRRQAAGSVLALEDATGLSARRKDEGCVLAENGRFHEAIARFQAALDLTPDERTRRTAVLNELQAQCYAEAGDTLSAIRAGERAVACDAQWADAHQTLGRAQLNLGEVELALNSFHTALHLDPDFVEVRDRDLPMAKELLNRAQAMVATADKNFRVTLAHDRLEPPPPPGQSTAVRHLVGERVCLSALPPGDLMRPPES